MLYLSNTGIRQRLSRHNILASVVESLCADDVPQVALSPLHHSLERLPGKKERDCLICTDRTRDIFAARQVMEKLWEMQKELHMVFIDLERANDGVPRQEVWRCLREQGVPE